MSTHLGTPAQLRVGVRTDARDIAHGDQTLVFCRVDVICTMCTVCVHPRKSRSIAPSRAATKRLFSAGCTVYVQCARFVCTPVSWPGSTCNVEKALAM